MSQAGQPLRIKRLTLTDFRAFPGPAPVHFDLDGKNLLVYGENGAGKSSIFHALRQFFSLKPEHSLENLKNVFSGQPVTACGVAIEFNDGAAGASWRFQPTSGAINTASINSHEIGGPGPSREQHPAHTTDSNDTRVVQTALRRACLDYRALLDTNYKHGDDAINLFSTALDHLLADFPVTVPGGTTRTIAELWQVVERAKPDRHNQAARDHINQACADFNTGFRQALHALHPHIGTLLGDLIGADVAVAPFVFNGVTYNAAHLKRDRDIDGRELTLDVSFRTHRLPTPQLFLNEARLSALGLAIYLAGRLACTPTATRQALKLLVLDDVLIGLDHSNRLPVLDVLRKHFADWQIVLLTYDRVWFEMARFQLEITGQWKYVEIFETEDVERGIPSPTVRATGDNAAKTLLKQAGDFLQDHHIPAAANYTRAAFEMVLKSFCERFGVPVPFKAEPRHVDTDVLLSSVERWLEEPKKPAVKNFCQGTIERVKLFRKVVLNPYSHASPPNIARAEVEGAIAAVEALRALLESGGTTDGDPIVTARDLLGKSSPCPQELHAALGFLRAAFHRGLCRFCERKRVRVAYRNQPPDCAMLWQATLADRVRLFPAPDGNIPDQIEAERRWLIESVKPADLDTLTQAELERVADVISPPSSGSLLLDSL